jgi:hypothetical protein
MSHKNEVGAVLQYVQVTTLNTLKIGLINLIVYQIILSVCPDLNFLKSKLSPSEREQSFSVELHYNLKQIIIHTDDYVGSGDDYDVNRCLAFVPNLQRLIIHKRS